MSRATYLRKPCARPRRRGSVAKRYLECGIRYLAAMPKTLGVGGRRIGTFESRADAEAALAAALAELDTKGLP